MEPHAHAASGTPLSHHAILELVAPFSRAGWALDLPASDRAARRLAFKPQAHEAVVGRPAVLESRRLEAHPRGWRLVRRLVLQGGHRHAAEVTAEGPEPAALLERVAAVPLEALFVAVPGLAAPAALQLRVDADGSRVLRVLHADVAGLHLAATVSGVKGFPAQIELGKADGDPRRLPDDLLEVLGRGWTRLVPKRSGWEASVMVRGVGNGSRSADAQARLVQTLAHLAQTFAEAPARFHERHAAARWRIGLLRGGPLAFGVAIVVLAFALRGTGTRAEATLGALANLVPPLLMALFFMRREMPRIELPKFPRRPSPDSWKPTA
jgi:hypothetical protein